jgi:hypothetical protein
LIEQTTSEGRNSFRRTSEKPIRASTPGRKFSTSTSDRSIRRARIAFASGLRRSSRMERLLRLNCAKYQDNPSLIAPWRRTESPSGASTLMTSAPMSPSRAVQNGPDRTRVRSRTFTPVSGIDVSHRLSAHLFHLKRRFAKMYDI